MIIFGIFKLEAFWIFYTKNSWNFANWKFWEFPKLTILGISQTGNFWIWPNKKINKFLDCKTKSKIWLKNSFILKFLVHLIFRTDRNFAHSRIRPSKKINFLNFYCLFQWLVSSGRSTFKHSLIFKLKTSAILKFQSLSCDSIHISKKSLLKMAENVCRLKQCLTTSCFMKWTFQKNRIIFLIK